MLATLLNSLVLGGTSSKSIGGKDLAESTEKIKNNKAEKEIALKIEYNLIHSRLDNTTILAISIISQNVPYNQQIEDANRINLSYL